MWGAAAAASSSSASMSPSPAAARLPKTMEDVWKDISLASDLPHASADAGVILQDFFSAKDPANAVDSSPPATLLTLSAGPNHHFGSLLLPPPISNVVNVPSLDHRATAGKRRFNDCDRNSGDRRHKRMIKNRESAARSRARKQERFFPFRIL